MSNPSESYQSSFDDISDLQLVLAEYLRQLRNHPALLRISFSRLSNDTWLQGALLTRMLSWTSWAWAVSPTAFFSVLQLIWPFDRSKSRTLRHFFQSYC